MNSENIQSLEVLLGHTFRDKSFLINALSHSSIKNDQRPSNERLEFLGDSVLGMVISHALYARFPLDDEGTLTRIKSQAVSRATLQRVAEAMGLDRYILVGKGVAKREIPGSLLGNLYEALVGAIYLDAGLAAGRKFVLRHLDVVIEEIVTDRAEKNYKSLLQHYCQRELGAVPTYRVLREGGPAHSRHFDVAVVVDGQEIGRARAGSKKEAEQGAARAAMIHYDAIEENPNQPVRGAGAILRVGSGVARKKGRRRGGAGRRRSGDAGEVVPAHTNAGVEPASSRRAPANDDAPPTKAAPPRKKRTSKKAPRKPAPRATAKKTTKKTTGRTSSRRRPDAAPDAASDRPHTTSAGGGEGTPAPKKKTRRGGRRKKKKTGGDAAE